MRILFIIPRRSGGGAERVIANLASGLAERHDVFLAPLWKPIGPAYPVSDRVVQIEPLEAKYKQAIEGIWRFLHLNRFSRMKQAKKNWYEQYAIHSLKRLKQKYRIDCSVSFLTPANYMNTAADGKCPVIISIRSCLEGEYAPAETRNPARRKGIIFSCKQADRIVSVSKEAVHGLTDQFCTDPEKISVIYNPCDPDRIRQMGKEMPEDSALLRQMEAAKFVFLSSGRITPKKGQWHLLHAFQLVLKRHPEALLVILGRIDDAKIERLLNDTIREMHMEEHVVLAGFRTNPFAYLSKGNVFVMSSFNEGFPNAILEAMALGLPVIATDCRSGPREILALDSVCTEKTPVIDYAEYGILTPECSGNREIDRTAEENELRLAEAMLRLMEDAELREHYAKKSLERAGHFCEKDILQQWEALIRDAVSVGRSGLDRKSR